MKERAELMPSNAYIMGKVNRSVTLRYVSPTASRHFASAAARQKAAIMEVLKQLHASVADAFEVSLDNAYNQLSTELALRDVRLKAAEDEAAAANEERINTAARFGELEREILSLREALSQYQIDPKESETSAANSEGMREAYAPERILASCDHDGVDRLHPGLLEIRKLVNTKYRALYGEVQTLIKVSGQLRTQIKRHKKKLMQWQSCVNRNEFTLVLDGLTVKFQKIPTTNGDQMQSKPGSFFVEPLETAADRTTVGASTPDLGLPKPTPGTSNQRRKASSGNDQGPNSDRSEPPSTMSDQSGDTETGSNDPTETTTRPQKRRRVFLPHTHPMSSSHDPEHNQERPVVKREILSSSPLGSTPCRHPPGTQDLDEIGATVETPTKRRGNNPVQSHQSPRSPTLGPASPVDGNIWANTANQRSNVEHRKLEGLVRHALPSVAEDGDDGYFETGSKKGQRMPSSNIRAEPLDSNTNSTPAQGRLQNLLETPMASRSPLNTPGKFQNIGRNSFQHLDDAVEHGSTAPHDRSASELRHSMENHSSRKSLANSDNSRTERFADSLLVETPGDEPYRARPLHRLELNHFKINPDHNQGLDFAYDTVMRKKDERQCAPGCMRPGCCREKFNAMVRLGGLPAELPRSYRGDQGNHKANLDGPHSLGMSDDGNEARVIANMYGKHRHHHQRPRSPPGFWRADMPSTQDLERDREEARKYEREKVKERYREAMRPGGLWKYADE